MSKQTTITIIGAAGRMGVALVRAAADTPDVMLVGATERPDHPDLDRDAGEVAGVGTLGVPIVADLERAVEEARVVIDFTAPGATDATMATAAQRHLAAVVGTTGLGQVGRAAVTIASQKVAVVLAPNMSVGINLMLALLPQVAKALGATFDLTLTETHHRAKRDAPSGTALRLEEVLRDATQRDVMVAALRGGTVVGDHTVSFLGPSERLEITHRAESRETFARGALRAATWVAGQAPGVYDMQDVLGLR